MKPLHPIAVLLIIHLSMRLVFFTSAQDHDSTFAEDSLTAARVVAYREQIKPVTGGYAVRVADQPVSKEAKAVDVLKYLPSLNVNNHSVKMDGRSSIMVFIDGRPVRMSGQTLVDYPSALPAGEIDRIEVQTPYVSDGVNLHNNDYLDTRSLLFTVSWRFGNWKKLTPRATKSNQEENNRL